MLSSAAGTASKNRCAWPYVFSTRRISNPNVVQKTKFGSLCPTKLRSVRAMCELDSPSFEMSLDPSDETSTEIDFAGHCIAVNHLGGIQLHIGENDVFKIAVEHVHGLCSPSDPLLQL